MQWLAYAIGAFYVLGGLMAINVGRMDLFLDGAIEKLTGEAPRRAERVRAAYAMAVGLFMLFGGLALLLLSRWAVMIFVSCALLQVVYLAWATYTLPPRNRGEAAGRRSGFNALAVYSAATLYVVWLDRKEVLL
jgi:hypothetical protein